MKFSGQLMAQKLTSDQASAAKFLPMYHLCNHQLRDAAFA